MQKTADQSGLAVIHGPTCQESEQVLAREFGGRRRSSIRNSLPAFSSPWMPVSSPSMMRP